MPDMLQGVLKVNILLYCVSGSTASSHYKNYLVHSPVRLDFTDKGLGCNEGQVFASST